MLKLLVVCLLALIMSRNHAQAIKVYMTIAPPCIPDLLVAVALALSLALTLVVIVIVIYLTHSHLHML
jgi:hypothetical protein